MGPHQIQKFTSGYEKRGNTDDKLGGTTPGPKPAPITSSWSGRDNGTEPLMAVTRSRVIPRLKPHSFNASRRAAFPFSRKAPSRGIWVAPGA